MNVNRIKDLVLFDPESDPVTSFTGPFGFLSNFHQGMHFVLFGQVWPTAEHAYQGMKAKDEEDMLHVLGAPSPGIAKRRGQRIDLPADWDDVRLVVMQAVVMAKFTQSRDLARLLVATGSAELVEGNNWGDTYWGRVDGEGRNHLGHTLMRTREMLRRAGVRDA